ncbi:hypothetical protein BGZ63DRAFT_200868 [Mariannaea sp. PMI_226]|nr:hypothetical protein BGZ63DRAFT_200868 [Mariannaea sp. PMI_226]
MHLPLPLDSSLVFSLLLHYKAFYVTGVANYSFTSAIPSFSLPLLLRLSPSLPASIRRYAHLIKMRQVFFRFPQRWDLHIDPVGRGERKRRTLVRIIRISVIIAALLTLIN